MISGPALRCAMEHFNFLAVCGDKNVLFSGDQLIGRIDPLLNRADKQLLINAVHVEPTTPLTSETGHAVATAIEELAIFLGATTIQYSQQVPRAWKHRRS